MFHPEPKTKSVQQSTPQKPEPGSEPESEQKEEYTVLGHFTQTQWDEMMTQKERDTIIGEIIFDLLNKVMDGCHKVDLEKESIRHTVSWAENYLIQMIQQQFLCLDEGDDPEEICRTKDAEPESLIPDSWARGCIPVVHAANQKEDDIVDSPAPAQL